MLFISILLVILFLIGLASHSISTYLYNRMVREKETRARELRVVAFVMSFLIIFVVIAYLFVINVRFER